MNHPSIVRAALKPENREALENAIITYPITIIGARQFAAGGAANVWKAQMTDGSGKRAMVAVKEFRPSSDPGTSVAEAIAQMIRAMAREVRVWTELDHDNILPMHGIYASNKLGERFDPALPFVLVSPYCKNGSLQEYLSKNRDVERMYLIRDILSGLIYLHENHVVHGDLKPTNVLISNDGRAVLADFGLSIVEVESGFTTLSGGTTPRYLAYERVTIEDLEDVKTKVTIESDIWAFGMTVLPVLSGKVPFHKTKDASTVIVCIAAGRIPEHADYEEIPEDVWNIIAKCWNHDSNRRPKGTDLAKRFAKYTAKIRLSLEW